MCQLFVSELQFCWRDDDQNRLFFSRMMNSISREDEVIMSKLLLVLFFMVVMLPCVEAGRDKREPVTNYYTPCAPGVKSSVSTFHGVNRDGQPPLDPNRRAYDFTCGGDKNAYSPTEGTIYVATPRYGGLLMIDDALNDVCLVVLHLETFEVTGGDVVEVGMILGQHKGYDLHFVAVNGRCENAGLYDVDARTRERPIIWVEFGYELPYDIPIEAPLPFVSQNPAGGEA